MVRDRVTAPACLALGVLCAQPALAAAPACVGAERNAMPAAPAPASQFRTVPCDSRSPQPTAPKGGVPIFVRQVNTDGAGLNITGDAANEPSIAVDPTDPRRLAVGWRQFDSVASSFRQAGCAVSRDAGRTWTIVGPLDPGVFRSDPVLRAGPDGTFYYSSLHVPSDKSDLLPGLFTSTDGGAHWTLSEPVYGGDKTWITIDLSPAPSPLRGTLHTAWNAAANPFDPQTYARLRPGHPLFDAPQVLPGGPPIFGTLALGPDGELYVAGTNAVAPGLSLVRSLDAGDPSVEAPMFQAMSPPPLDGDLAGGLIVNPAGLAGQAYVDVDRSHGPARGWVYVLASVKPNHGVDPLELRLTRSRDGGQTWDPYVRVSDDDPATNSTQWFGTLSVAPNGRLDVIYNSTHEDTEFNNACRTYYTYSTDHGDSFEPSIAITPVWYPYLGWPQQLKIGDYYDMVSDNVGANAVIATTVNGEQDVFFVRLGEFDCNNNAIGDATEIAMGLVKDCDADGVPDECLASPGRCAGDINGDGRTDTADLVLLLLKYGRTVPLCDPANLNVDTVVDLLDLELLLAGFGCS